MLYRSGVPANASIQFCVWNQQGAALVIKHPAYREDTRSEKNLKDYMLQHYRSWIAFFRDNLGYDVALQDIILVTGCDLTADWEMATFNERTTQCDIEFKVGDPAFGPSGSSAFWGTWQSSIHAPHRCGPCPTQPPVSPNDPSTVDNAISQEDGPDKGPKYNQCIFLRGFRVRERKLLAPQVIQDAAEPQDSDINRDVDEDIEPIISSLDSDSDESDVKMNRSCCSPSPGKVHNDVQNYVILHIHPAFVDKLHLQDDPRSCFEGLQLHPHLGFRLKLIFRKRTQTSLSYTMMMSSSFSR